MAEKTVSVKLTANTAQFTAAMAQAGAASNQMASTSQASMAKLGGQMQSVGRGMSLAVTAPIVAVGGAAIKMSMDFSGAFTRMQSLAGVTADEVDGMKEAVLDLAGETGRAPQELAEGLYFLRSSGLDAGQAMDALGMSAKASAAGLGSTAIIADAVSSAMNAYAQSGLTAAEATDTLVATARAGKAEPEQLAGALGRILPIASELGVTFQDVGGAVASLSLSGNDASTSATLLSNILSKLLKPSQQGAEALAAVGMSTESIRASIKEKGLLGTLEELKARLGDAGFVKFLEDAQAVQGALALTGQNAENVRGVFDQVRDSVGATGDAFSTAAESDGFAMKQAWAQIQIALISAGDMIVPVIASVAGAVGDLASAFNDLPGPAKAAVVGVLGIAAAAGPMLLGGGLIIKNLDDIKKAAILMEGAAIRAAAGLKTLALSPLGPFAAGVALGVIALKSFGVEFELLGQKINSENFDEGLQVIADGIQRVSEEAVNLVTLSDLRGWMSETFDPKPVGTWAGTWTKMASDVMSGAAAIEQSQVRVATGFAGVDHTLEATAEAYRNTGIEVEIVNGKLVTGADNIKAAQEEFDTLRSSAESFRQAVTGQDWGMASFNGATTAMSAYNTEFFGLANIASATEAAYDTLDDALEKNGRTFDLGTEAGRANQKALQALAGTLETQFVSAYTNAGGSMDAFKTSANEIREGVLVKLQSELGISAKRAGELADQMGLTEGEFEARFILSGDEEAKLKLGLLQGSVDGLPDDVAIRVNQKIIEGDYQGALAIQQDWYDDNPVVIQAIADTAVAEAGLEDTRTKERVADIIADALTKAAEAGLEDTRARERIADIVANAETQAASEGLEGVRAQRRVADIVAAAIIGDASGALAGLTNEQRDAVIYAVANTGNANRELSSLGPYTATVVARLTGLGAVAGALAGVGRNADGTDNWRGGLTWVGERGPELVDLPAGSKVYTAERSAAMTAAASGRLVSALDLGTHGAVSGASTASAPSAAAVAASSPSFVVNNHRRDLTPSDLSIALRQAAFT